jgi:hypothetical protein
MVSKNLSRRLEWLEAQLLPAEVEEGPVLVINFVGPDQQVTSRMEMQLPPVPRPKPRKRW